MVETFPVSQPPAILAILGNPIRWQLLSALGQSDLRAREMVELLKQPQNLVSYHLQQLRRTGLVNIQHSTADGREVYYSLDLDRTRQLYASAGESLHPAMTDQANQSSDVSTKPKASVLFLCTHNSARSQMAEGILQARATGNIEAFSAGTEPTTIHPFAIQALKEMNVDISHQQPKSVQEFLGRKFDYIITVCDRAREVCPVFPGDPVQIHWSFPDPVEVEGPESRQLAAFREIALQLNTRIAYLLMIIGRKAKEELG